AVPAPGALCMETHDGRRFTYADMLELSARFAGALAACGVAPGDRVAAQVDKSVEALMFYLGCVRAGAVFLPLDPAYTIAELAYFFGDAEPRVVVCTPARESEIAGITSARVETLGRAGDGSLVALLDGATSGADVPRGADDLAAILYTSGTTGRSKGAMLSHENLASNARTLAAYWRFTRSDVLIHALPIFHTHGLFVATNTLLLAGAPMIPLP